MGEKPPHEVRHHRIEIARPAYDTDSIELRLRFARDVGADLACELGRGRRRREDLDQRDATVQRSANNLAGVKTLMAHYLNVIDLLNFDTVVISRAAVDVIESYHGQGEIAYDDDAADTDVDTTDGEA